MHAEKCPVCEGAGDCGCEEHEVCHGCDGDGWVEVHDSCCCCNGE